MSTGTVPALLMMFLPACVVSSAQQNPSPSPRAEPPPRVGTVPHPVSSPQTQTRPRRSVARPRRPGARPRRSVARPPRPVTRPRRKVALPCKQALRAAKARFGTFRVRARRLRGSHGNVCNVVVPVILYRGPSGLRFGAPRVSCAFAQRLLRFEKVLQQEARRAFGEPVKKLMLWSSYRCSIIAGAGGLPSEHASGNAIDLGGVVLRSGRRTTVLRHYPRRGAGTTKRGKFWVRLAKRLYRDGIFTVVLTPRFNRLHHNHLHLDGASYSVDGT